GNLPGSDQGFQEGSQQNTKGLLLLDDVPLQGIPGDSNRLRIDTGDPVALSAPRLGVVEEDIRHIFGQDALDLAKRCLAVFEGAITASLVKERLYLWVDVPHGVHVG